MKRTISGKQLLTVKHDLIELADGWEHCFGPIPRHCIVFAWGHPGNGKTQAMLNLAKVLTRYGKVLYNSCEEHFGFSMQNNVRIAGLHEVGNRFQLSIDSIEELSERLEKPRSPEFVFLDSVQAMGLKRSQIREFVQKFPNKMLIFISWCEGNTSSPRGKVAQDLQHDAHIKIWVSGFKAFSHGRFYGDTGEKIIWEEGARRAYGKGKKEVENGNEQDTSRD